MKQRPPPNAKGLEYHIDYSTSQLPVSDKWHYIDPEYPEIYHPSEGHIG